MSGDLLGSVRKIIGTCTTMAETPGYADFCDLIGAPGEYSYNGGTGIFENPPNDCRWGWSEYPTCKKVAYTGSSKQCCLKGVGEAIDRGYGTEYKTCDPKYIIDRQRSPQCRMEYLDACKAAPGESAECRDWVNAGSDPQIDKIMDDYCATNMNNKFCQEWCVKRPGKCDRGAVAYCKDKSYDDDFCACLTSPASSIYNPACVDSSCRNNGYKLMGMNTAVNNCPDIVDCSIVQQLNAASDGKIVFDKMVTSQNCGNDDIDTPVNITANVPEETSNKALIMLIVILFIICSVIFTVYTKVSIMKKLSDILLITKNT